MRGLYTVDGGTIGVHLYTRFRASENGCGRLDYSPIGLPKPLKGLHVRCTARYVVSNPPCVVRREAECGEGELSVTAFRPVWDCLLPRVSTHPHWRWGCVDTRGRLYLRCSERRVASTSSVFSQVRVCVIQTNGGYVKHQRFARVPGLNTIGVFVRA